MRPTLFFSDADMMLYAVSLSIRDDSPAVHQWPNPEGMAVSVHLNLLLSRQRASFARSARGHCLCSANTGKTRFCNASRLLQRSPGTQPVSASVLFFAYGGYCTVLERASTNKITNISTHFPGAEHGRGASEPCERSTGCPELVHRHSPLPTDTIGPKRESRWRSNVVE